MKAEIKIIFSRDEVVDLIKAKLRTVETYGPGEFEITGRWTGIPSEIVAEFKPREEKEPEPAPVPDMAFELSEVQSGLAATPVTAEDFGF